MAKRYEIRIFNERFNMNPIYYLGEDDIQKRIFADTDKELLFKWKKNLKEYEGETYSIWEGIINITGGAYDPSDIECITEYLKRNNPAKYLVTAKELEEMVRFGIEHPDTEFSTEPMNDGIGDFLSCTFFDKDDNNASGFWELDQSERR